MESLIYCDNRATGQCQTSGIPCGDDYDACLARARAKGWHMWEGYLQGGKRASMVLCPRCIGTNRSRLAPAPQPLPGDQTLIQIEAVVDPHGTD